MYYLISQFYLIKQYHTFNGVTNSTVLSRFTFSSISIVYKFTSLFWFHSLISFNSPTYSKVQQIQYSDLVYIISVQQLYLFNNSIYSTVSQIQFYYLISHSHLILQCHTFNSVNNSTVLSRFTFSSPSTVALIQQCHKFSCIL